MLIFHFYYNNFVFELQGTSGTGCLGITQFNVGIGTVAPTSIFHVICAAGVDSQIGNRRWQSAHRHDVDDAKLPCC